MAAKRILIVEGILNGGARTAAMLKGAGYFPVLSREAGEALRLLSNGDRFDAVLLDTLPPGADGLALLDDFRRLRPDTPVVVVASVPDVESAVRAIKSGAFDYLSGPVADEPLLDVFRSAFQSRERPGFDTQQRQYLEQLVEARTEMLRRAVADLERSYDITLEALGNALDLKDAETQGHSKRVTAYTIALARALRMDDAEVKIIARGAFLHDIGKMAIPDAILAKPGRLTPEEQAIMREHPVLGYAIVSKIPFLQRASEIVFSHQEHFDGSGYSQGLKAEEIPLGARIFAIADAMDAITSDRPYRKANSFAEAKKEIERCSGTQFDPAIVAVYRTLPEKLWEDLRAEIDHPKGTSSVGLAETLRQRS